MAVPRLYCPALSTGVMTLSAEESHHAVSVLRLKSDARVALFDGLGSEGEGVVESADRRGLRARVNHVTRFPFDAPIRMTLAVALPKAHRQAFLVEKCTELGVDAVWPLVSDHAVAKTGSGGVERLRRRAIEAAKQCGRKWIPEIRTTLTFNECRQTWSEFDCVVIAHPGTEGADLGAVLAAEPSPSRILVLIGPEGGWSTGEVRAAREEKARFVRLGATVLRTETAALAVCAALLLCVGSRGTPTGE